MNGMNTLLVHWVATASLGAVLAWVLPGISFRSGMEFGFGVALGLANALVRPTALGLGLPMTVVTLALAYAIVNGVGFGVAAALSLSRVSPFVSALIGALLLAFVSWILGSVAARRDWQHRVHT